MAKPSEMKVTVNIDEVCNDALFEFAANFYKKTGLRLRSVNFDWMEIQNIESRDFMLRDVTVTSSGSGK